MSEQYLHGCDFEREVFTLRLQLAELREQRRKDREAFVDAAGFLQQKHDHKTDLCGTDVCNALQALDARLKEPRQ